MANARSSPSAASSGQAASDRFTVLCIRCERQVVVREGWVGREVQCPYCSSVIRVPQRPAIDVPIRSDPPNMAPKKCFNFACPRCGTLLEAHTGMCSQHGSCPTCGARFIVPFLSRAGGRPEKARLLEGGVEAPTPVHAYAASGAQAPTLKRHPDGSISIVCPRCGSANEVDADVCHECRTPFTMEAAPTVGGLEGERLAIASVTLGVAGVVLFPLVLPGLIGAICGVLAWMKPSSTARKAQAMIGLVASILAVGGGVAFWVFTLR
ncbi:MAG: DUF4190 domain-containing protein [Planctomycetota bacterium]|nr:MAG: DUF4190 domain-containing protein [Planctomycetota bacterium]